MSPSPRQILAISARSLPAFALLVDDVEATERDLWRQLGSEPDVFGTHIKAVELLFRLAHAGTAILDVLENGDFPRSKDLRLLLGDGTLANPVFNFIRAEPVDSPILALKARMRAITRAALGPTLRPGNREPRSRILFVDHELNIESRRDQVKDRLQRHLGVEVKV
jgi:hypothetical protein